MVRTTGRLTKWAFWVYLSVYVSLLAGYGMQTSFMPAENDVLGIISVARGLTTADWSSFHNDFFGAGLPITIALVPQQHSLAITSLLALAASAVTLIALFALATQLAGRLWALVAVAVMSITPLFLDYSASAGPDMIALGLCMVAFAWFGREVSTQPGVRTWVLFGTGTLFGLAGLFRYHFLVLGVGLIVWSTLGTNSARRWRAPLVATIGIFVGFLPQIILNLLGGFGPIEIGSAFYVYESALGVNWFDTASIPPENYSSVARVVLDHPREVITGYLLTLTNYVIPIAALTVSTALTSNRQHRVALIGLLAASAAYAFSVSIASSPRGPLATLPMSAVGLAFVAHWVATRLPVDLGRNRIFIGSLTALVIAWPLLRQDMFMLQEKSANAAERADAEASLIARGTITNASQVLTNDFDLYFTSIPGGLPDRVGGWEDLSLNGDQRHRTVDLSSIVAFHCDAQRRGITTVLWRESDLPFMDGGLSGALNGGSVSPRLRNEGRVGPYVVTRLSTGHAC